MKKLLIVLLIVFLVFAVCVGAAAYFSRVSAPSVPAVTQAPAENAAETPAPDGGELSAPPAATAEPEAAPETAAARRVDLEALHAQYEPDSVYATVGGCDITWQEYFEWLGSNVLSAESYLDSMAAYGLAMDWSDEYTAGTSFADYVVGSLNDNLRVYTGIDLFAAEIGVEVTEKELEAARAEDMRSLLGEDATEEEWAELLVQNFMTDALYRRQAKAQLEIRKAMELLYGENGEKLSAEELQAYLDETGYLHSNHILFLTIDAETREALDEATVAAKKAQAEKVAAELQAIGDTDELLARFAALKAELDEDSGKDYYPDGYIFKSGMVEEFMDATRALADYEVSDPVLSVYGYHVIIRLPITAEMVLDDGSTIGYSAASRAFALRMDETVDALDFELAPGAEPVDLTAFLH